MSASMSTVNSESIGSLRLPHIDEAVFEQARVGRRDRAVLRRLYVRWRCPGRAPGERLRVLLDDYSEWRTYRASRAGDAAAARRFAGRWRSYLRRSLSRSFTPAQLEELTARFFERVYRLVGSDFHWNCPFTVYLRRVAANLATEERRRLGLSRQRWVSLSQLEVDVRHLRSDEPGPDQRLLRAELTSAVRAAIARLPELDRRVVAACLLHERPADKVAAELGLTRAAVYQRLYRAKRRLRQLLRGHDGAGVRR